MFHVIPLHMIHLQWIFGRINFDANLINICACFFATVFIIISCSVICSLHKQIKLYTKKLIQLQFISNLILTQNLNYVNQITNTLHKINCL